VEECLARLRTFAQIEVAQIEPHGVFGHWTKGGYLAGDEIYAFTDYTYLVTEWGCLLPETIRDKGSWAIVDGILILTPDPDVTWPLRRFGNRRYVPLRFGDEIRLFGLDGSLSLLARMVGTDMVLPAGLELVRDVSYAHSEAWEPEAWRRVKRELLKTAWRPSYFAGDGAP
jgi:hypothetical protein